MNITFTPPTAASSTAYSSSLYIADTINFGLTSTMSGTGVPAAPPTASLSPGTLNFGGVQIDSSSPPLIETVTNTGGGSLNISNVSIVQSGTNAFFLSTGANQCTNTTALTAGQTCDIYVTFDPSLNNHTYTATLDIADNATGTPQTASLTGAGDYFYQSVGSSTSAEPVSVFITTSGTLNAENVVTTGAQTQDFAFESGGTCVIGTAYSAGQVCTVDVVFSPQYAGFRNGSIYLTNSSGNILGTTFLAGTGNAPQLVFTPSTPAAITGTISGLFGVAVDGTQNLYYVDGSDNVTKLPWNGSSYGTAVTIVNIATALGGQSASCITIDANGNLYVGAGFDLEKIPATGVGTWGTPTAVNISGVNNVTAIGVDGAGNLYLSDPPHDRVAKLSWNGSQYGAPASLPFPGSGAFLPSGVAVNSYGDVFALGENTGSGATEVLELPVNGSGYGTMVTVLVPSNVGPAGLALDGDDDLYVSGLATSTSGNLVLIPYTGAGTTGYGTPETLTKATSYGYSQLTVDGAGNVYAVVQPTFSGPNEIEKLSLPSPSSLTFAQTAVGQTSTDSPKTVSVTNIGNEQLDFYASSSYPTDFPENYNDTHLCNAESPLNAGAECDVSVNFTPTTSGNLSENVTLKDENLNNSSSSQLIAVSGIATAASAPIASLSPNPLAFPSTTAGSTATALPVTLSNTGTAALTGISVSVTGTNPTDFATTSSTTCGTTLAAGTSCLIYVSFTPASTAGYSATVSVADNAAGSPQTVTLTGTGTAAPTPQAVLSPNPLAFPGTLVGTPATALAMTLSNPGAAALTITSISVTGTNASSFAQSNNCGSSLAASATCTITVVFTPASAGSLNAAISVADNATGSPQSATVTGTGTQPQAVLAPNPLAFPSTVVGTAATALPMTLSNPGTAALAITGISVTGANASSFGQSNNCGTSLAVGATCTITVTFTPGSASALSAAISVADNATSSPQSAAVTGTGTTPLIPQAVLSPNPLAFPSTTINTSATPLPMTLSNPGTAALAITGISVTGTNASSFGETNNCGATLAAGATCTITVSFTPASAAGFSAAISVADNAAGSPQSAVVTGTGSAGTYVVNSSTPSASVQPGSVAQFNIVVAPLGGSFNNLVTLSATGLPAGAQYSFLPPAVTPGSAGAPSVLSIQTSAGLARLATPQPQRRTSVPLLAMFAGLPLLGLAGCLRQLRKGCGRWMLLGLAALAILPMLALSGCGGGYFGPAPQNYTVTVTGTSGALQESTTITLTVQ